MTFRSPPHDRGGPQTCQQDSSGQSRPSQPTPTDDLSLRPSRKSGAPAGSGDKAGPSWVRTLGGGKKQVTCPWTLSWAGRLQPEPQLRSPSANLCPKKNLPDGPTVGQTGVWAHGPALHAADVSTAPAGQRGTGRTTPSLELPGPPSALSHGQRSDKKLHETLFTLGQHFPFLLFPSLSERTQTAALSEQEGVSEDKTCPWI